MASRKRSCQKLVTSDGMVMDGLAPGRLRFWRSIRLGKSESVSNLGYALKFFRSCVVTVRNGASHNNSRFEHNGDADAGWRDSAAGRSRFGGDSAFDLLQRGGGRRGYLLCA